MSATTVTAPSYTESTASMLVDPEALHHDGAASESSADLSQITSPRCATAPRDLDWVPDREQRVVPEPMATLCRTCPGRAQCLLLALAGGELGYWAATTSRDRAQMQAPGDRDVATADRLQQMARHESTPAGAPLHGPGEASYFWYRRRGCRCTPCRQANSAQRAAERANARHLCAAA